MMIRRPQFSDEDSEEMFNMMVESTVERTVRDVLRRQQLESERKRGPVRNIT